MRRERDDVAMVLLAVTVAGALGVAARYGISSAFHGDALPWATVAINVAGSFLLGVVVVVDWLSPEVRTVVGVGLLGGFTTFSAFSLETVQLLERRAWAAAGLYVAASVTLSLAALALGLLAARKTFA